jgi:hypothetical protein
VKRNAESLQAAGLNVEVFAFQARSLYSYVAAWIRLRPRLHPGRYDVVHTQAADALLTLPHRVPLVITVTSLELGARLLARRADAVVVPSEEIGRQLHTRATVHVLPPGLDDTTQAARLMAVYRSVTTA